MKRSHLLRLLASSDASRHCFAYQILSNMQLRGVNLGGAVLRWTDLRGSDLRDANLSCSDLEFACLKGADLTSADLSGACLKGADLADLIVEVGERLPEVQELLPESLRDAGPKTSRGFSRALWTTGCGPSSTLSSRRSRESRGPPSTICSTR